MSYMICVPSRNRASWLTSRKMHTLKLLSHLKPKLVVRPDDPQWLNYMTLAKYYGAELVPQANYKTALGAGQAYDFCVDYAIQEGVDCLYILNDDSSLLTADILQFPEVKYCHVSREVARFMLDSVERVLGLSVPAVTFISMMRRGEMLRSKVSFCKPLMGAYCLYVPHFRDHPEYRFWVGERRAEAYCDYNLSLRLLREGYLTAYFTMLIIETALNNPGGCSDYRTLQLEEQGMEYILEKYPEFARASVAKNWGKGVERKSATIQWKKAFDAQKYEARFGVSPSDEAYQVCLEQEHRYASLISMVRTGQVPMRWEEQE